MAYVPHVIWRGSFCCGKPSVAFRSAKVAINPHYFRGAKGDNPASLLFSQQKLFILHPRLKISHGAAHAGQLGVFLLGDLDAIPLPQFHHDVEKVHAVEFELFAERHFLFQIAEVFVGRDVVEDVEDGLFDFGGRHGVLRNGVRGQVGYGGSLRIRMRLSYTLSSNSFHNHDRIDAQHAERVVQNRVDSCRLARLVGHQARQIAHRDRAGRG